MKEVKADIRKSVAVIMVSKFKIIDKFDNFTKTCFVFVITRKTIVQKDFFLSIRKVNKAKIVLLKMV